MVFQLVGNTNSLILPNEIAVLPRIDKSWLGEESVRVVLGDEQRLAFGDPLHHAIAEISFELYGRGPGEVIEPGGGAEPRQKKGKQC